MDAEFLQSGCRIWHGVFGWINVKILTVDYQADMPENWTLLEKSSRLKGRENPMYHRVSNIPRRDLWEHILAAGGDLEKIGVEDTVEMQTRILEETKNIWKAVNEDSGKKAALEKIKTVLKNAGWSPNKWLDVVGHAEKEKRDDTGTSLPENYEEQLLDQVKKMKEELGNLVAALSEDGDSGAFFFCSFLNLYGVGNILFS